MQHILCPESCTEVSLWKKPISNIVGKLFSTYRIVFELAQYRLFEIPKQVIRIASMRHLSRKKHWPYVKIVYLHHFYVFYHYHQFEEDYYSCIVVTSSLGKITLTWGALFFYTSNIFALNILSKTGKSPALVCRKLFLIDESQDFDKYLACFDSFLDAPSAALQLTLTVFIKWKVLRW